MSQRNYFIACDFDGTLCEHRYPAIGAPKPNVIQRLKAARVAGAKIIIWTCRPQPDQEMLKWLKRNEVPFDYVNENPEFDVGSPKIYADEYWDDRAINVKDLDK